MRKMSPLKLQDDSADKKYFMVTPQLVWALCRSPYDYTLWDVIKMIAGEKGECYLSTEDLATLAMMSTGKVSECRKYLIDQGLLQGQLRRDPGYPQPVWHLRIPDLWKANVEWRQKFESLEDRIALKIAQKKSLHLMKASPGEEGISPDEGKPSPGETKKNHEEEPKEEPKEGASPARDYLEDVFNGHAEKQRPGIADPSQDIAAYMQTADEFISIYHQRTGLWPDTNVQKPAIKELATDGANLDLWDEVVTAWVKIGWSKRNVAGMIEHYQRGEIPSTGGKRGTNREQRSGDRVSSVEAARGLGPRA